MKNRDLETGAAAFSQAARQIVTYLNTHTPLTDWSVSRVAGGEQVHVHVHHVDIIEVGKRVAWGSSFCNQMLNGAARIVPDSHQDPAYARLPDATTVRSYAACPITDDDGSTFGVLCGVSREPLADASDVDADLVALMGDLLSAQLAMARAADRARRTQEISDALASTDALTGLVNRRGWEILVADAQQRITAFGDPVAVAVIDVDGLKRLNDEHGHQAGDELLRTAGTALLSVSGPGDRVARYGGDEFVILSNNVAIANLDAHFDRFVQALAHADVSASIGHAVTGPGSQDLTNAFAQADDRMYAAKRAKRQPA